MVQKIVTISRKENDFERIIFKPSSEESTSPHETGNDNVLNAK
tara:strand:+ start:870 stop:998 length:129 start_codon:yes stop_codon:yes gene_type:complete